MQDADRLDALGGIGIGRAFAYGGARGRGLGETVGHFEEKLVRLEGMMKTGEGRRLARVRGERVRVFRGWVREEMGAAGAGEMGMDARVGVGVGGAGTVGMGNGGGLGRGGAGDPARQLVDNDTVMSVVDGGSSEEGDSSDSG